MRQTSRECAKQTPRETEMTAKTHSTVSYPRCLSLDRAYEASSHFRSRAPTRTNERSAYARTNVHPRYASSYARAGVLRVVEGTENERRNTDVDVTRHPMSVSTTAAFATARASISRASPLARRRAIVSRRASESRVVRVDAGTTSIQFVKGVNESSVPEVRLTRSKDGTNGTAFFVFAEPDVFENGQGDITGMFLNDEEGEMSTVDVNAKFVNGKPSGIEARYVMKTESEWSRFMRFMERYAEDNGLGFSKK